MAGTVEQKAYDSNYLRILALILDRDNRLWVGGSLDTNAPSTLFGGGVPVPRGRGGTDGLLVRMDANLKPAYILRLGGESGDAVAALADDLVGGIWGAGRTQSSSFELQGFVPDQHLSAFFFHLTSGPH